MEVAIPGSNNGGSPFQREVREWQRIDPNTGALLTGRLEADRWINGSLNSYGKVVDSKNVSQPNGTQHSKRKQLEVLQARTSSGSMQVIRAHTVQTTSSRWTSSSASSSSNSSSPLMSSLTSGGGGASGHLNIHPQRFHTNRCLTNEPADSNSNGNNGPATDEDHLTSNFHLNHHPKQDQHKQHHLFSTTPSLKLSNLMKSTPSITNGTSVLHKTATSRQKQKADPTTPFIQHTSSSSSMSSTSTPVVSSRSLTTTSSGAFRFDSSRYDLPTTEAYEYVGEIGNNTTTSSGSGKVIDICSRDIDDVGDDDDSDVDRVNSSASRCRRETAWQSTTAALHRGRSISTEDLTSNGCGNTTRSDGDGGGGGNNIGDDDEPAEWRRVSKIRRSFQFPSTSAPEASKTSSPLVTQSRPADLPELSVSVSKIRAELENGRRLSTAMRNNHVDLVALDNILNGGNTSGTASPLSTKKKTASFLTAESLKEIRGKLKKLSDESLYRDDFVTKAERDRDDGEAPSQDNSLQYIPRSNGSPHTTNSLESRTAKCKDTSSAEWHLRRKSYGFEKMSPPDDKSMFRFENSTDSGLGRSSDLGNWSPTTDPNNPSARGTVITFGEQSKMGAEKARPIVQRRLRNRTQPQSDAESAEMKRHSIAVDESQYVRENLRKTSAVHLNGFGTKDSSPLNSGFSDDNSRRQKRVEFCKTEVHFAAESGRVNIVETDGKPPPSNNFRRRRRSSSSSSTSSTTTTTSSSSASLEAVKNGLPVIHFGDERKPSLDETFDLEDDQLEDDKSPMSNVTVSIPVNLDSIFDSECRDIDDHQDEISIRGILKNKPIKPKPYHLGENIESTDALWGVQLKPVAPRSFSGERDQTEEEFKETTVSAKSVAERIRIVEERKEGTGYSTKINLNLSSSPYEWTDTEVPKSNIMNIELHSPLTTTIKKPESIRMQAPIAKPRTIPTVKESNKPSDHHQPQGKPLHSLAHMSQSEANDQLKIVKEARGARKLREHELSYFGVKVSSADTTDTRSLMTTSKPKLTTTPKRSLPSRRVATKTIENDEMDKKKWSLPNDKPDLLRHSPILVEPQVVTKTAVVAPSVGAQRHRSKSPVDSSDDQADGLYENIKKPMGPYCREKDLARDEMILSEMTKTADQTLKALSDEATQKDLRRSSISRRSSKPLETIDEKFTKALPKTTTRSKTSTHRIVRECTNRPSSASSGDSRSSTPTHQRSRSRSRENTDYVNVKPKTSSSRCIKHRSSSRESQKSATSSTEEATNQRIEMVRKSKRSTTKDEPLLAKRHHHNHLQRSLRNSVESQDRSKVTPRSSIKDRAECPEPHHSRSQRNSHVATKTDVEHKRNSHVSTGDSRSSAKTSRSRPDNEKPERVSRSKAHSSHSQSEHHHQHSSKAHRSMGSKSATVSSSGNNSDTIIHSKNARSSSSSASKSTAKRSSKDRK